MAGEAAPFTPEIASSKQMQSEHTLADDAPLDVNMNAVYTRLQAETAAVFGRVSAMNADRREKLADGGVGIFKPSP